MKPDLALLLCGKLALVFLNGKSIQFAFALTISMRPLGKECHAGKILGNGKMDRQETGLPVI